MALSTTIPASIVRVYYALEKWYSIELIHQTKSLLSAGRDTLTSLMYASKDPCRLLDHNILVQLQTPFERRAK